MRFYEIKIRTEYLKDKDGETPTGTKMREFEDYFDPIFEEFDKKCYMTPHANPYAFRGEEIALTALMYDHAFKDADEEVRIYACRALSLWGFSYAPYLMDAMQVRECTATLATRRLWRNNSEQAEIFNRTQVQELFNALGGWRHGVKPLMVEEMVSGSLERESAEEIVRNSRYKSSLGAELARIYDHEGLGIHGVKPMIPAHYILEGVNPAKYGPALESLLGALSFKKRLPSSHIFHMKLSRTSICYDDKFSREDWLNERLFESLRGNVLIVEYGELDTEASYDRKTYSSFCDVMHLLREFLDEIQVIFLVPPKSGELQRRIRSCFMAPLVTIAEDVGVRADSFASSLIELEKLAEGQGLMPDEALAGILDKHMRNRTEADLDVMFQEWRKLYLTKLEFPQYEQDIERYSAKAIIGLSGGVATDKSARERLEELVGLEGPKRLIDEIIARFRMNQKLAQAGKPTRDFAMHSLFYGSPGTGKTVVARLYGEILMDAGILREGRLIEVSGSQAFDLEAAFDDARGSVLFIDEAYALVYTSKVAELIALMENRREDTVVILAGYKHAMKSLLECNEGFASRIGFEVEFPDYTEDELWQIFELHASRAGMRIDPDAEEHVRDRIAAAGSREDQGNARYVRKLFEDAAGMQQVRLAKKQESLSEKEFELYEYDEDELVTIMVDDVMALPGAPERREKSALEELHDLIGLEDVKLQLERQLDYAVARKERRERGMKAAYVPMHMAFLGNPGTGKTECARLVARAYKEAGILSVGELYECGRQDLISPIVGATAQIVTSLFMRAKGSVIFIDEAYSLLDPNGGGHGEEAVNAIIQQMENLRDDVVVIFAGYTDEVIRLLDSNPGFRSRVKTFVDFDDYSTDELVEVLQLMASKAEMKLEDGVEEKVRGIIESARKDGHFGNARFVRNLLESAQLAQAHRLMGGEGGLAERSDEELVTLLACDFEAPECRVEERTFGFI